MYVIAIIKDDYHPFINTTISVREIIDIDNTKFLTNFSKFASIPSNIIKENKIEYGSYKISNRLGKILCLLLKKATHKERSILGFMILYYINNEYFVKN